MITNFAEIAKMNPQTIVMMTAADLTQYSEKLVKDTVAACNKLEDDRLIGVEEACKLLGVTRPTLWRWNNEKYLCQVKIGSPVRYHLADVMALCKVKDKDCETSKA